MSDEFRFLPPGVLIDILSRLPVNTLFRCTCVCKSWYSLLVRSYDGDAALLTDPSFIAKHLNRSNNNELLLVRSYDGNVDDKEHYSLRYDNELFAEYAPELEFPLKSNGNHFRIIGVCNGVICLSEDQFMYLFLWNPSIRKMMPLPPVRVTFDSHGPFTANIGFGFDPITDDYKVVRIVQFDCFDKPPEIDLFTVSSGTWRNISPVGLPHININERAPQAFLKGASHWSAARSTSYRSGYLILSFHMGREEFGQITLPHNIMAGDNHLLMSSALFFRVAKFQESLAVIHLITGSQDNICSIWVMKEYGEPESWTKKFNIDMGRGFNSVAGFTRKGEVLLATSAGYLVAHNPKAGGLMHLYIRGTRYTFYADAYTESLVLLGKRFGDTVTSEESSTQVCYEGGK